MGFLLFRAFLAINAFKIATENPIYKYRFQVYPVDSCPMNASEFESAARRRNCTGNSRYLCAPDIYLSNLIEFCTDRNRLFYGKGNCVRLEGTGDLNHYSCVDRFTSGCPTDPYQDDKIFEYPMCLAINRESKCFISEKNCPERSKEDDERNKGKPEDYVSSYSYAIFIFMIALASVVFGATLLILRKEIKKRTDIPEEEANDKDVQEVDRNDEMQINENALREYLSKGKLTMQHIRCIIVGCAGAGKTTLLSRLKNIPYEELKKIESTEIIDVHVNIFEVNKEEETIKCVDEMNKLPLITISSNVIKNDNKTEEEIVADESVQSKRESEEIVQEKKNSTEKSGTHGISSMERKEFEIYKRVEDMREKKKLLESYENKYSKEDAQDDKEIPNTPDKNSPTIEEETFLQLNEDTTLAHHVDENNAISKIMDAVKQLSNEKDLRPRITFLDFAGQSLYYAFHQIYLSPKTCYILVVDMTKYFNERPDTDDECAGRFTSWTYEEYYKFWLKSIDSFSDTDAPVVVVGTHADKLSKDQCNSFFQTFYDLVNNHFDLRRHLNRKRQFTIGFPESGSNLDELKDIKKCIASLLHDPEKIKAVWALFEHILEKEKIGKVISRKTVSNINEKISKEFRLTDRDITDMLLFLHRVGTLLYFDENQLKETIILDIQWFAQAFKSIVAYDVDVRKNDDKRERFLHTGEIDDDELNRIWMEKDSVYLSYKTEILSYMEQLGLLAACKTGKKSFYYVPSMNKRRFKDEGETMTNSSILCFQFDKHGQLPVYLFYSIVLKCLKIPEWSILQAKGENCIYDKVACFSYHHLIVVMCLCKFQIQVQLRLPAEREIVQELREKVQNLVEEKIKECKKYVFQIGYKCENGIFNNEDEDSFVALEKFSVAEPLCNDCPFSKKHYLGKEICWVQRRKQTENREIIDSREADAKEKDMPFSRLENLNFARLSCIIFGPLTDVLRSVLEKEISPPSLSKRVNEYLATLQGTKRYVITNDQKTLISEGDYSKFDITLLYYLCRNVCAIPPHTNQWGNRPSPEDRSVSANIERIRLIRNEYAHTSHPSISNSDFKRICQKMLNIIQQLEKNLGTSTEFHDAVLEIKTKPMNQEESTKYIEKLDNLKVILDEGKLMESSIIPRNATEMMKIGISKWREDDKVYVETHNFQAMLKKVRNQPFVTFVGVPGSGKTATARHIALILQTEGYEIIPINDIRNIETFCDPNNPQVFLVDDFLGVFGLIKSEIHILHQLKHRIMNPIMLKSKILMTCREVVYRNDAISHSFFTKEEYVVYMHGEMYALSCEDKNALLAKYNIDPTILSTIKIAQTSLMFPFLCKLFSFHEEIKVYGPNFFISPVVVILKELNEMRMRNTIHYAALVLLMTNQNTLTKEDFHNFEIDKGKFYQIKSAVLRNCKISPMTDGFEIYDALNEMEGTFVKKCGSQFIFSNESMFNITAYHFGCQFPAIILQNMKSDYIANYIKVKEMNSKPEKDESCLHVNRVIDLCIRLQEPYYQMFAERLFRDVGDGEIYNVFTNEALKHPLVIMAFINVMKSRSYTELYATFLVDLEQMFGDGLKFQCQRCQNKQIVKLHLQLMGAHSGGIFRAISLAISFGHHHVLQFLIDWSLTCKGNINDLFEISYKKDHRRFSDVKQKEKQTSVEMIMEQCQLLCLGCCSGDLNTVQILLRYVDKDAINNRATHAKHVYLNIKPLVVACTFGYLNIAKELVKAGADVNLRDGFDSPLAAARKEGHLNVVEWLRKAVAE